MISIRRYLTRSLALVLAAATALTVTATYIITEHEMEEILDAQLSLQGRLIAAQIRADTSPAAYRAIAARLNQPGHLARRYTDGRAEPPDDPDDAVRYHHEERMLAMGFWNGDATPLLLGAGWNDHGPFPPPEAEGYRWVDYGGERWRVFSLLDARSETWIRAGIQKEFIDELGGKVMLGNLIPMLIALPLLLLATAWTVKRGLKPIGSLSRQVAGRNDRQLSFIDAAVPRELNGLQTSINDFIARLRETLERERRFTADAAHELRTPLAGLKIHLDNARAGESASLDKAYTGVARLQRVVEQLLVLARLDRGDAQQAKDIDIYPLVLELIAELWPWAQARDQTLEVTGLTALRVRADPVEMGILVRNLVDNALRYTPDGGRVTLELSSAEGEARLIVSDTGPGIPEAMLTRVTERFRRAADQRITGSGLGLSIVLELAQRQRARLILTNREPHGLEVSLAWPSMPGRKAS
ncbi:ATP-binding protein [Halomonas sp. HP20-15]|uniref:ATP-binding protein n=1 Tax=Halomonas sp. HP20-15 TaxID=3085901 RepID=UPI002980FDA6|nr:ATP-binding protein [Halomonas sp. HP20-15]MDW5377832.1 ATP-binding protein [Halomonas sp. HP20-15]